MLVAFCKDHNDKDVEVKVIKFADRIWANEAGGIECHREIYLDLKGDSLRQIFMLTMFRHILELQDLTDTFLDENYPPNLRSSGKYELTNARERLFSTDFLKDIIAIQIKSIQYQTIGECSLIQIIFEDPIEGPAKFALRFKFKVKSVVEDLEEGRRVLELSYFQSRHCEQECNNLDVLGREIKAVTILDEEKSGGFDILIHLPLGVTNVTTSEHGNITHDKLEPNGRYGEEKRYQCIWHMRQFFGDEIGKEIGLGIGQTPYVEYNVESAWDRVEDLKEALHEVKGENKRIPLMATQNPPLVAT